MQINFTDDIKESTMNILVKNASNNLQKLLSHYDIPQKELAAEYHVSTVTISSYVNGKKMMPYNFLMYLRKKFNISFDDFLFTEISFTEMSTIQDLDEPVSKDNDNSRYLGSYVLYYLDSSGYKNITDKTASDSLLYGLLCIYDNSRIQESSDLNCFAILGIRDKETAYSLNNKLNTSLRNSHGSSVDSFIKHHIMNNNGLEKNLYSGDVSFTNNNIFLTLDRPGRDKALIILHRPPIQKEKYIGGLGAINSVAKGYDLMPCCQFIGLSRYNLCLSEEELHRSLLLGFPEVSAVEETKFMIAEYKKLFNDYKEYHDVRTDQQKEITLRTYNERFMRRFIENNILRFGKISAQEDDKFYHMLKHSTSKTSDNF